MRPEEPPRPRQKTQIKVGSRGLKWGNLQGWLFGAGATLAICDNQACMGDSSPDPHIHGSVLMRSGW